MMRIVWIIMILIIFNILPVWSSNNNKEMSIEKNNDTAPKIEYNYWHPKKDGEIEQFGFKVKANGNNAEDFFLLLQIGFGFEKSKEIPKEELNNKWEIIKNIIKETIKESILKEKSEEFNIENDNIINNDVIKDLIKDNINKILDPISSKIDKIFFELYCLQKID